MGTSRLNNRDRLFIRIAKDGTAIANSAIWRKVIPRGSGRWKDITSAVLGCCSATDPTESSYIILQAVSGLDAQSTITGISFPGYSWTGTFGAGDFMVIPLPYDFNETVTFTTLVEDTNMDADTSTIIGDGVISPANQTIADDPDPQTFELTVTSTPSSQYLVILSNT